MTPPSLRHVLITTDAVGGVWTYALDLAGGLISRGVKVTLAVLGPSPDPAQRRAAEQMGLALIDTRLPLDWMEPDPRHLAAAGRCLAALATASGADLVHLNSPALAAGVRFAMPVVGGCHSCLATWWAEVKGGDMPPDFLRRTEGLAKGYAACDRLIAPSDAFMQATAALYQVTPNTVRNGRSSLRRGGRSTKQSIILTSGRLWDAGKNVQTLDRAAGGMRNPVYAIGPRSGPNGETIGLRHIHELGRLEAEAVAMELERAAIFTSLSLYEPFGLGVLEAAQAGCALVLSDIPTFRELWQDAALFVPPEDDKTAGRTLDALVDDPTQTAELGQAAAARADQFTSDAMVEGVLAVYAQALAARTAYAEAAA